MNRISATIIADSLNTHGQRLTTFVLVFPRIVLAEFNTHRMLSRNSASSRAIPFIKMVKMVQEDPFIPIGWQLDHPGMQGQQYFEQLESIIRLRTMWLEARDSAVQHATELNKMNLTKQLCNRLLEPFLWHTVICTGTEWENFFALRAHKDAEIHICELAQQMLIAYNENEPKKLEEGEWHIPFGHKMDDVRIGEMLAEQYAYDDSPPMPSGIVNHTKVKIATARCARVSYLNFEGKDDYNADIKLYDRLLESGHMSPFEHCATAMTAEEMDWHSKRSGKPPLRDWGFTGQYFYPNEEAGWSGNFRGFIQHRKMLSKENKKDPRVGKKEVFE